MLKIKIFGISGSSFIAFLLLSIMAVLMLIQSIQWTTTMDESPHIVSGYSYLKNKDFRLNPEHPPLIKMAAGFPLLFKDINFPYEHPGWTNGITEEGGQWGQWGLGDAFLHGAGNDPVSITFWARIGMIVITILMGVILFRWARNLYGAPAGIFALTLFVFSPTLLAHGHLVTTDAGAAFAFLLAVYYFIQYLQKQTTKNLVLAGVAFGIANLMKFSLVLLIPHFFIVAMAWVLLKDKPFDLWATTKRMLAYSGKLILIGLVALAFIYPFYQYSILNYPAEMQVQDSQLLLRGHMFPQLADAVIWMADKPVLRALGHFFLGHLMVFQRVAGGNTVYYLGDVASSAWQSYFPVVFMLKEPLALMIMLFMAVVAVSIAALRQIRIVSRTWPAFKDKTKRLGKLFYEWGQEYFVEFALALFVLIYWVASIMGNLNIGVRHVLPTFPFIYILLAGIMHKWIHRFSNLQGEPFFKKIQIVFKNIFRKWIRGIVVIVLVFWYIISTLSVFPHTLAYFNELAGGAKGGHRFVVDSNLDWGQDLRGLARFVEKNNIDLIKLNYFGGGSPEYYLGERYEWFQHENPEERQGWIAISATLLQEGRAVPTKGYQRSTTHYMWLNDYEPVVVIGHSIFVYYIE